MKAYTGIIAIAIIIGLILIAIMFGLIPGLELFPKEQPELSGGSENMCDYDERDTYTAVCGIAGKTFNYVEFQAYSDSLDLTLCGVDDYSSIQVINDYKQSYSDMTLQLDQVVGSSGWSGTLCIWTNQGMAYGVIAGEGASVSTVFNKDVMYLTGKGTYLEWQQFLLWATS